jgi:RNase P subunit RPR2
VPKSTRVTCHTCRAPLGVILNDRLTVEGHRVEYGPKGALVITCTTCKTQRPWVERKTA